MSPNQECSADQRLSKEIRIISANVRGFHTNVGELTHQFVNKTKADIVFTVETFLDEKVPCNYARIPGYSKWIRKDRNTQGGGIALCHKLELQLQAIEFPLPDGIELLLFKIIDNRKRGILFCGCYRPPSQGTPLLDLLMQRLDHLMTTYNCHHFVLFGDLNQHRVQATFDEFMAVYNLQNFVDFPTHRSGSSLDPVVTDLPPHLVRCAPLGFVGTSDHEAVLTKLNLRTPREEVNARTLWKWERANWPGLREAMSSLQWKDVLQGDVDEQVNSLTSILLKLQDRFVPHTTHLSKPSDQPWFGPSCKRASDKKYQAWIRYKNHPTARNKDLHRQAVRLMQRTQKWAIQQWETNMKMKLREGQVGSKLWWNIIKEKQGNTREDTIPPLVIHNGTSVSNTQEKAEALARHFSNKMKVPNPQLKPPSLPVLCHGKLCNITTSKHEVEKLLRNVDAKKATGPDGISPRLLQRCAKELSYPLTIIFNSCLKSNRWPQLWKQSNVVPVFKKGDKSWLKNYRPISLLSITSKILEKIIASRLIDHLNKNHLLSNRQYGFRKNRSAADLQLLMTADWTAALDRGQRTCVFALDIEGAFDRVWHLGLIEKLKSYGVDSNLLELLNHYLHDRQMRVVLNGKHSAFYNIQAGVPQGSIVGPLMWNIFLNDLLHLIPEAKAFADDGTVSITYEPTQQDNALARLNEILTQISEWGTKWQVSFAQNKTQLMVIERSESDIQVNFNGNTIRPQQEIEILGTIFDKKLTFKSHIESLARRASQKLTSFRRISWLLDDKGKELLYKAQIRSTLEYSCLSWGGANTTHLSLLDKIQERAKRIIRDRTSDLPPNLDSLQHRRDVAGLTTMYRIHRQEVPHLQPMRLPGRRAVRTTRRVEQAPAALEEPRCCTAHYQRQFLFRYAKLWNEFICIFDVEAYSLQGFKCKVHVWLRSIDR